MNRREIAGNFLWRNLQTFSTGIVWLFVLFISAKFLSPERFGLFNYLLAILALLVIFCDFGISTSISKYVAEYKTTTPEKMPKTLFSVSIIVICASLAISLFIILVGKPIFKENYNYILLSLPYLFLVPLVSVLDGFYRGLKEFKHLSLIHLVVSLISLFITFFLIKNLQLNGAIVSLNILYFLLAIGLIRFRKETTLKFDKTILVNISRYALFIGLAQLAYFMYTRVDILIMKQFGYMVEIGYYSIIDRLFTIIILPAIILGQVIAPDITRHISLRNLEYIRNIFKRYLFFLLLLAGLSSFILYFILLQGINMFLNQYYTPSFLLILKILIALLPFKICGVFTTNGFIVPSGFVRIITIWTLIGGVLNIIFDYLFIWLWGFIGVFLSTLVIHSSIIVIENFIFYRRLWSGQVFQPPRFNKKPGLLFNLGG